MRDSVRATKWSSAKVPALTGVTRYEVRVPVRNPARHRVGRMSRVGLNNSR